LNTALPKPPDAKPQISQVTPPAAISDGELPPGIDGVTLINDFEGAEPRPGEIRRLRITEAHDYDVVGTLLEPTENAPVPSTAPLIQIAV
jgi:hypothetical protein